MGRTIRLRPALRGDSVSMGVRHNRSGSRVFEHPGVLGLNYKWSINRSNGLTALMSCSSHSYMQLSDVSIVGSITHSRLDFKQTHELRACGFEVIEFMLLSRRRTSLEVDRHTYCICRLTLKYPRPACLDIIASRDYLWIPLCSVGAALPCRYLHRDMSE